ncbi:hypothetical protein B0H17DRAFT_1144197 [Mycena rosella]|uniref:Uncharacterized protein n=1 Tax=Mycena rosella TaxID=1033263 RepID=A0AAD7G3M3_MYCRO|nr:hypothetical protein B0H17DRAFT_1144197 [Mycena rosella]
MSSRIHVTTSDRSISGRVCEVRTSLNATKIDKARREEARKEKERLEHLTWRQRRELDALRDVLEPYPDGDEWEDDALHSRAPVQISHAGEALPEDPERADSDLFQGLRLNQRGLWGRCRRYHDTRTRRNRTQLQVDAFAKQLKCMVDAYLELGVDVAGRDGLAGSYPPAEDAEVRQQLNVVVVDVFCEWFMFFYGGNCLLR